MVVLMAVPLVVVFLVLVALLMVIEAFFGKPPCLPGHPGHLALKDYQDYMVLIEDPAIQMLNLTQQA